MSFEHINSVTGNNNSITFNIENNFFSTPSLNFTDLLFGIVESLEIPSLKKDSSIIVIFSDYSDYIFIKSGKRYFELIYADLPQYYLSNLQSWIYNPDFRSNVLKKRSNSSNPWARYKRKILLTGSTTDELKVNAEINRINAILGIKNDYVNSIVRNTEIPDSLIRGREFFNLEYKEKIAKLHFLYIELRRHEKELHAQQLNDMSKYVCSEKVEKYKKQSQKNKYGEKNIRDIIDKMKSEETEINQKKDEKRKYWGPGII